MKQVAVVLMLVLSVGGFANAQRALQILERTQDAVTIGNETFSVTVENSGRLENLQAGGTTYVSFIALYPYIYSPELGHDVRAVQGEQPPSGLGPLPESIDIELRGDRYLVRIMRTVARDEVYEGAPLCEMAETIDIRPNGYVQLRYEFNWLRYFVPNSLCVALALRPDTFRESPFWADYTTHRVRGQFTDDKNYTRIEGLRGNLRTLQVDSPEGPFDLWIDECSSVQSSRWGEGRYYAVLLTVPKTGRDQPMYRGITSTLSFSIKLPIGQAR